MSDRYYGALILDVIDKGLDALGESPKDAIWVFLEKDFNLNRNELPGNVREFQEVLQKIFGMGYNFLDTLFCHYLEKATGKKFQKNQSFCECVECLVFEQSKLDNNEACVALHNNEDVKIETQTSNR